MGCRGLDVRCRRRCAHVNENYGTGTNVGQTAYSVALYRGLTVSTGGLILPLPRREYSTTTRLRGVGISRGAPPLTTRCDRTLASSPVTMRSIACTVRQPQQEIQDFTGVGAAATLVWGVFLLAARLRTMAHRRAPVGCRTGSVNARRDRIDTPTCRVPLQ